MTEVNGISPCSSLAFVGGTDRHGVGGRMKGKWEMEHQQGQAWDKPASLQRERGKKGIEETISYQSEFPAN